LERSAIPSQEAEPAGQQEAGIRDNIYSRDSKAKRWCQADSHHSLTDGTPNPLNVRADTSADRILFSDDFMYWGGSGPPIPAGFLNYGPNHVSLLVGRNHKNSFPEAFVEKFVAWIRSQGETGYLGEPLDWCRTP
jgi:putative DNA base modification enzyme with NMAD domain